MRKYICLIMIILSCKKEQSIQSQVVTSVIDSTITPTIIPVVDTTIGHIVDSIITREYKESSLHIVLDTTTTYKSSWLNKCIPEMVNVVGLSHYKLTEWAEDSMRWSNYTITLTNLSGNGEVTGFVYTGKGTIIGINGTSTSRYSQEAYGRQLYNVSFHAAKGDRSITFLQSAAYYMNPEGIVLVDTNKYSDTCK